MANLPENAKWETGIYLLEEDDYVLGGVDGVDNKQAKQLANRTQYLKQEQDKLKTATAAATTAKTGTVMLSSSVTSGGETKAATEKAAKTAYDRAQAAYNLANGKANASHTHAMNQVTGLEAALATKAPLASPALTGSPTAPTAAEATNTDQIATTKFVKTAIAALVGGAPAQLDTLKEIATALGNKANLEASLLAEIGKKAAKATTLAGYGIADFVLQKLTTEDLDTVKKAGLYYRDDNAGATTALHYPEQKAGVLDCKPSTFGWQHEYTVWDAGRKYVRNTLSSGAFSAWWRVDGIDKVGKSGNETISGSKTFNNTLISLGGYKFSGGGKATQGSLGMGATDVFLMNPGSRKTLQLKDDGSLRYSEKRIYVEGGYEPKASIAAAGIVQLSSSLSGTSEIKAATEKAVRDLDVKKANLASPALTGTPTAPTAAQTVNNTQIATTAFVKTAIAALVGGAPTQLDTLKEIATALGNKANLEASLLAEIGKKANSADALMKSLFIGIPVPYPLAAVPSGFLAMNGQTFSKTTYPILAQRYPTGRLPDLRGEFIRGLDNGRGIDAGRSILSNQIGTAVASDSEDSSSSFGIGIKKVLSNYAQTANSVGLDIVQTSNDYANAKLIWSGSSGGDSFTNSISNPAQRGHFSGVSRPRNIAFQYICLAG